MPTGSVDNKKRRNQIQTTPSAAETVPFLDLKTMHAPLMADIRREIDSVIESHAFALGPAVEKFERAFADYCGDKHCVGLNSGTSAVHVALLCAGVQPGDEVITTPSTWISTTWAISYIGATPVFVDIDPQTFCLDAARIEQAITAKTKAIMPVHLYGHPADMEPIVKLAREFNLAVIEDAAQAHGARYQRRTCGRLGDVAAFSFYPGKNLGAFGEAGAVVTDNAEWADRARALRDHAQEGRHNHTELGFNFRMDGIQAAVLNVKLRRLDQWNDQRRQVAEWYEQQLRNVLGLTLPTPAEWAEPVWHIYAAQHHQRDALRAHLNDHNIQSGVHYPKPVHLQPAYAHLGYRKGTFPEAEALAARQISLPMFPDMTEPQVTRVAEAIRAFTA